MPELIQNNIQEEFYKYYNNKVQLLSMLVDPTFLFAEMGRGSGKTKEIIGSRFIRVAYEMPQSTVILAGPTFIHLQNNILPNLLEHFRTLQPNGKPLLTEGIHYVVGKKELPKHFKSSFAPVVGDPKYTISTCWGTVARLVSADRPEGAAGLNAQHLFMEETKHLNGKDVRTRIFPALRGNRSIFEKCRFFQGITAVTDTARVDLGEDDWFTEYEQNMNKDLITDIVNIALYVEKAKFNLLNNKDIELNQRRLNLWQDRMNSLRTGATLYLRNSSLVNKDILGFDYFMNQYKNLDKEEFLSSILSIRMDKVGNMFFAKFNKKKHCYSDSYNYTRIDNIVDNKGIEAKIDITSEDLKYVDRNLPLFFGWDPGQFSSLVVAQKKSKIMRVVKNFYTLHPEGIVEMAEKFARFFAHHRRKEIFLHYDRAGNKRHKDTNTMIGDNYDTDAKIFKIELEKLGWSVHLMSLGKRTIFYSEHYALLNILFGDTENVEKVFICSNECEELISSIHHSPLKKNGGVIELDKSSEVKLSLKEQIRKSTQLASSLTYLLFGEYEKYLPTSRTEIMDYSTSII